MNKTPGTAPAAYAPAAGGLGCAALENLAMSTADRVDLATQGFVTAECGSRRRRRYGPYYKLRRRRQGRQQVRYLGPDLARAEEVRRALTLLQESRRREQEIRRLLR